MIRGMRPAVGVWLVVLFGLCGLALRAQTPEERGSTKDVLVYKDGDRLHGEIVQRGKDIIVFKSDRFGELRVPASEAVIIAAEKPREPETKQVVAQGIRQVTEEPPTPAERAEQEKVSIWDRFSPAVLTARVREFFGPWHGRIALSNDVMIESSTRESIALDGKISRKFKRDTLELTGRYDYNETDDEPTTDVAKGSASWRHEFGRRYFTQYRPAVEWNRGGTRRGRYQYVLLQQELGAGVNLVSSPSRKLRFGISENLFDIWSFAPGAGHGSRAVESLFDEVELALPWRMALTQRGVWYPVADGGDGWENKIELNKKLTETLSVAVRHELRENNPDGASNDYTRLKLLLGFDF